MGIEMAETTAGEALTHHAASGPMGQTHMVTVARTAGVSPFAQMIQMLGLKRAPNHVVANEYYDFQLYRPGLTMATKREFIGERGSFALNLKLSPPGMTHLRGFLSDKAALTTLFGAWGLPTTTLRAVFSPHRRFGTLTTLRSAAEVEAWLLAQDRFPIFGKPGKGCQALGSVRIEAVDRALALVHLSTGRKVALAALAGEVAQNAENGYVFQDVVEQHPEINAMIGCQTVSTLRVVTVVEDNRPKVLYTVWKLGSALAMSDNFWQQGSLIAHVDAAAGTVLKCRYGSGTATQWVERHPVTGVQILGRAVPNFANAVALALEAHGAFPINGILGWDIALTPAGACLIECNENTGHALYQYAADRGVMNPDFAPVFDRIIAQNQRRGAAFDEKRKAHLAQKAKF